MSANPYRPPAAGDPQASRSKSQRRSTLLFSCGGAAALLHWLLLGIGVVCGSLISTEEMAEFVIIATVLFTPVLLMPTWLALYQLYRRLAPRLSKALLVTGAVGFLALLILPALLLISDQRLQAFLPLLWMLLLCNGLWLIVAGYIGMKTRAVPGESMALAQTIAGIAWMSLTIGLVMLSIPGLTRLAALLPFLSLCVFVLAQFVWSSWFGIWLLRNAARLSSMEHTAP